MKHSSGATAGGQRRHTGAMKMTPTNNGAAAKQKNEKAENKHTPFARSRNCLGLRNDLQFFNAKGLLLKKGRQLLLRHYEAGRRILRGKSKPWKASPVGGVSGGC